MADAEEMANVIIQQPRSDPKDAEISKLSAMIDKLQKEKDDAEKSLVQTQKKWEDKLKEIEDKMSATGLTSQVGSDPASHTSVSIPITPDKATQGAINVQIEHKVKGDHGVSFNYRVRPFSGNSPKSGEVTFEEWEKQVELVLEDDTLSDKGKRQKILNSLNVPALDLARSLGVEASAKDIVGHLNELYGSVANGVRLLHEYFGMKREPSERLTDYLQRLAIKVQKVVKRGGLKEEQVNETLLTHFKSSCNDERISQILHIKYYDTFPSLKELIKEVKRVEEDFRQPIKKETASQKVNIRSQAVPPTEPNLQERLEKLEGQMKEWGSKMCAAQATSAAATQLGLNTWPQQQGEADNQRSQSTSSGTRRGNQGGSRRQRLIFCYNCGLSDGHLMQSCKNDPNPVLVQKRLMERQAHPRQGGAQNNGAEGTHLKG